MSTISRSLLVYLFFSLFFGLGSHHYCAAEDLDPASQEALTKTQELLNSPSLRAGAIEKSPNAQMIDSMVKSMAGNQGNADEFYQVSGEVLEDIVKKTGGDPAKMQELLAKAKDNPKGFAEGLSEKSQSAIRSLSSKLPPPSVAPQGSIPSQK